MRNRLVACMVSCMYNEPVATITLDIESTPEAVWTALTTDEGLAAWMGEGAVAGTSPGDLIVMPDVVTGRERRGRIGAVDERERLTYTWWPEDDPLTATNVAITLEPCEIGTRVTVVETNPSASASASLSLGATSWPWRAAMLSLAATLVSAGRVA